VLPWEIWRASFAALRQKGLRHMLEHADRLERLENHPADQVAVDLDLTDDFPAQSFNTQCPIVPPP
jgi:hypothetical protein